MDINRLKSELTADPVSMGYAALSDTGTNERAKNIHRRRGNDRLCGCWSSLTVA